jgi:hypothetical protein
MAQASESGISELRGYARGLEGDPAAVVAGLRLVWSSVTIRVEHCPARGRTG